MSDLVDVRKILQRLAPEVKDGLAKLCASPAALEAVMVEVRRGIAEREVARAAEVAQLEAAALERAAVNVMGKMSDQLAAVSAKLGDIERTNRYERIMHAANAAVHRNGRLFIDPERFYAELGGGNE